MKVAAVTDPPPRLWWLGQTVRIARAAGRPWLFALALLGSAGVAFPVWDFAQLRQATVCPAGPMIAVAPASWPHPRRIGVGWAFQEGPAGVEWTDADGRFGIERWGYGLGEPKVPVAPIARPPGAAADLSVLIVSVWWLLGPLAAWSACAGWRAIRQDGAEPPSRDRRLARPWLAVFAAVGIGLLASGLAVFDPAGPNGTAFEWAARRTPAGSWHPREVHASVSYGSLPVWSGPRDWKRGVTFGFWWLVILPLAFNLATLVRRGRPRSVAGD